MNNAIISKKIGEGEILLTIITLNCFKLNAKLQLNKLFEVEDSGMNLGFAMQRIDPSVFRVSINKVNIIVCTIYCRKRGGSPYISIDKFKRIIVHSM